MGWPVTYRAQVAERRQQIAQLVHEGLDDRSIGEELGIPWAVVYRDREYLGLPVNRIPAAEIDTLTVELAVAGAYQDQPLRLTTAERHLAVQQLVARGHLDRAIARMLGVCCDTILRDRHHLGLPTPYEYATSKAAA